MKKPKKPIIDDDADYDDIDDEDITDEQLEKAIKDFDAHKEFSGKVKFDMSRNTALGSNLDALED